MHFHTFAIILLSFAIITRKELLFSWDELWLGKSYYLARVRITSSKHFRMIYKVRYKNDLQLRFTLQFSFFS